MSENKNSPGKYLMWLLQYGLLGWGAYALILGRSSPILLPLIVLAVLAVCAIVDIQKRLIPRPLGWGILGLSFLSLGVDGLWWGMALLFVVLALSGTRFFLVGSVLMIVLALANTPYPDMPVMVFGIMTVLVFFHLKIIGGGDAQIWLGMTVLSGGDLRLMLILLAAMMLTGFVLVFRRRGLRGGVSRFWKIGKNLSGADEDTEAIRMPWAVTALLAWTVYVSLIFLEGFLCRRL